jgi:glycosyltransferase involved in cell wall biosynthesis
MDVVFVGHRCCDHSPSSGYDQVCALFPESGWLDGRALEDGHLEWLRESKSSATIERAVFHVFYGDCSGKQLPALLRARFPEAVVVSSAHQPVCRLQADEPALAALKASDAIITVSDLQAHELSQAGVLAPIRSIPHGVWTNVFCASGSDRRREHVLIVGSFLRDWSAAKYVIRELARTQVRCIALGAGSRDHLARADVLVDGLQRVSEAELINLYGRAAAVFLPFLEATASNALLEAMAVGCPVVCPRIPSLVDEYLGDDVDAFPADRLDIAVRRLLHYVRHPQDRESRSRTLTARAQRFDWSRLKPQYQAVYERAAVSASASIARTI